MRSWESPALFSKPSATKVRLEGGKNTGRLERFETSFRTLSYVKDKLNISLHVMRVDGVLTHQVDTCIQEFSSYVFEPRFSKI